MLTFPTLHVVSIWSISSENQVASYDKRYLSSTQTVEWSTQALFTAIKAMQFWLLDLLLPNVPGWQKNSSNGLLLLVTGG